MNEDQPQNPTSVNYGTGSPPDVTIIHGGTHNLVEMLLGRVESEGSKVSGKPEMNSTRWVFNVSQHSEKLEIKLILPYRSTPRPTILSHCLTPLSSAFWDARVYIVERDACSLVFHARKPCRYRVTVDSVHSRNR